MAEDITSSLNPADLDEFRRDFKELLRLYSGIDREYSKMGKDADRYIFEFKQILSLFNKKYKNLAIKLKQKTEGLILRIFIREKSVKEIFINAASRMEGLKSAGADSLGFMEDKKGMVELRCDKDSIKEFINESSPQFRLCSYYAVKDGVGRIDVHRRLSSLGFVEAPSLEKSSSFLKRFNPRIEE